MKKIICTILFFLAIMSTVKIEECLGQWVKVSGGLGDFRRISSIIVNGTNLYTGIIYYPNGVWMSTNNGGLWTQTTLINQDVHSLTVGMGNMYAGTINNGVFISTNNGVNWTQTTLNNKTVRALLYNAGYVYAGTTANGIYISTNNGTTWGQTAINNQNIYSLAASGSNIFAGSGSNNGVYISTNNGANWTQTSLINQTVTTICANGSNIYAGTLYGVYRTTNNGNNWSLVGLDDKSVYSIVVNGSSIIAGTDAFGVYLSTNNGVNWTQKNEGIITSDIIYTLMTANNYIFAGLWGTSIWRRPVSELITSVKNLSTELPSEYKLYQNYPNPFNSMTNVKWQMLNAGNVKIVLYDITGREIATLVNEKQELGLYEITFDAGNLPSGVYIYRMQIENSDRTEYNFIATKKMVFLK